MTRSGNSVATSSNFSIRPKLLFVGAFPPVGGKVIGGMVTACAKLMASDFPALVDVDPLDTTQISNPPPGLHIRGLYAIKRFFSYIERIERKRPDAVLLFASAGASFLEKGLMAWYARIRGVPALLFPRGGALIASAERSPYSRRIIKFCASGATKFLCQGPRWQQFAHEVCGFSIDDAPIIPNWTATQDLLDIGRSREPLPPSRPVQLVFVGWLDRSKGVMELLNAAEALAPKFEFTLVFAGEGNVSDLARKFVANAGLDKRVRFYGWIKEEELQSLLGQSHVFVLPSYAEGLPNAMIEAMAAGLAVVVTSVGNIPDFVEDGKSGIVVERRNAAALQAALSSLLGNRGAITSLGIAAHNLASEQFSTNVAVQKLVSTINEATMDLT